MALVSVASESCVPTPFELPGFSKFLIFFSPSIMFLIYRKKGGGRKRLIVRDKRKIISNMAIKKETMGREVNGSTIKVMSVLTSKNLLCYNFSYSSNIYPFIVYKLEIVRNFKFW